MSKNVAQVYVANPVTSIGDTDLFYTAATGTTDAAFTGATLKAAVSPLTTKGDLYTYSTVNARLAVAVGDGKILQVSSGAATGLAYSTPTYPSASATSGSIIISDGTNFIASTSLWPNTVGTAGKIIRSDGTTNAYTTSTFADTYAVSTLLYAASSNAVSGLATANSSTLQTNGSGVPSWVTGIPLKSVNTQLFTSAGAFTYTPTSGCVAAIFEIQAAGGGSGGTTGAGGQSAAAGAGGGGAYMRVLVTGSANLAAITGTVGAAGLAGSSGNNAGGTGTASTLVVNSGTTWSAGGGVGGGGQASSAAAQASGTAGAGGTNTVGTNGTLMMNLPGQSGGSGFSNGAVTIVVLGPAGGSSFLGKGGASTNTTGLAGTSFGGGASGTYNGSGANAAGVAGGIGFVMVTEFCTA